MNPVLRILFVMLLSVTAVTPALAQDEKKGNIENTVGPMGDVVLRARLNALGYSDVKIDKTNILRYRIEAMKKGKRVSLFLHPQTGQMVTLGPDGKPVRAWHMPVEPQPTGAQKAKSRPPDLRPR